MVHGCMVYTERAEPAAVSCGTSHASVVSTPLRWIFENARERRIAINNNNNEWREKFKKKKFKAEKLFESGCG